jgi:hypothetical protein
MLTEASYRDLATKHIGFDTGTIHRIHAANKKDKARGFAVSTMDYYHPEHGDKKEGHLHHVANDHYVIRDHKTGEHHRFSYEDHQHVKNHNVKEETLDEALKLTATHTNGNRTAKVYRDKEWEEHRVKHFVDGVHQEKADYHTDDKEEAHSHAKQWANREGVHAVKEGVEDPSDEILHHTKKHTDLDAWKADAARHGYAVHNDTIFKDHHVAHVKGEKPYGKHSRGSFNTTLSKGAIHSIKEDTMNESGNNPNHETASIKKTFKDKRAERFNQKRKDKEKNQRRDESVLPQVEESTIHVKKGAFHAWLHKDPNAPITAADIAKGKAAGGHAAKMATFAQNFGHVGEETELDEARRGTFRAGSRAYFRAGQTVSRGIHAALVARLAKEKKEREEDESRHTDAAHWDKSHRQDEAVVNELSKGLLGRYIKKASGGLNGAAAHAHTAGQNLERGTPSRAHWKKAVKRINGIEKATDRLTKEEVITEAAEKFPHLTSVLHGAFSANSGGQRHDAADFLHKNTKHHALYHKAEKELVKSHSGKHAELHKMGQEADEGGPVKGHPHTTKALDTAY